LDGVHYAGRPHASRSASACLSSNPETRREIFLLFGLALVLAAPLAAQATHDATLVQASSYRTDPGHTLVQFDVNHFGFRRFFGV
jgi:hypothetical protein